MEYVGERKDLEAHVFQEDIKRLKERKNLTYLTDGWEDLQCRSVHGSMLAEILQFPVVLGLEDLSGVQATVDNIVLLSNRALAKKEVDPKSIIVVCTNNPTTMQAFWKK